MKEKSTTKHRNANMLAINLKSLLKNQNLHVSQLAQILNIPMMTIRRLLSGETTDPRVSTLALISDYFNVPIDSLIGNSGKAATKRSDKSQPNFIPKLDWETVEQIDSINELDLNKWEEWQPLSFMEQNSISNSAFALESRPSMHPRFPQGTIFIIDPEASPRDGDIVLIKLRSNNELTLREFTIDPPEWQLHPVVAGSTILRYSKKDHKIVGINLLTMFYRK